MPYSETIPLEVYEQNITADLLRKILIDKEGNFNDDGLQFYFYLKKAYEQHGSKGVKCLIKKICQLVSNEIENSEEIATRIAQCMVQTIKLIQKDTQQNSQQNIDTFHSFISPLVIEYAKQAQNSTVNYLTREDTNIGRLFKNLAVGERYDYIQRHLDPLFKKLFNLSLSLYREELSEYKEFVLPLDEDFQISPKSEYVKKFVNVLKEYAGVCKTETKILNSFLESMLNRVADGTLEAVKTGCFYFLYSLCLLYPNKIKEYHVHGKLNSDEFLWMKRFICKKELLVEVEFLNTRFYFNAYQKAFIEELENNYDEAIIRGQFQKKLSEKCFKREEVDELCKALNADFYRTLNSFSVALQNQLFDSSQEKSLETLNLIIETIKVKITHFSTLFDSKKSMLDLTKIIIEIRERWNTLLAIKNQINTKEKKSQLLVDANNAINELSKTIDKHVNKPLFNELTSLMSRFKSQAFLFISLLHKQTMLQFADHLCHTTLQKPFLDAISDHNNNKYKKVENENLAPSRLIGISCTNHLLDENYGKDVFALCEALTQLKEWPTNLPFPTETLEQSKQILGDSVSINNAEGDKQEQPNYNMLLAAQFAGFKEGWRFNSISNISSNSAKFLSTPNKERANSDSEKKAHTKRCTII